MSTLKLRPYQVEDAAWLAARDRALIGHEMRVGKSPIAIAACDLIKAERILVACPAIACEHWKREFQKWSPGRPVAHILDRRGAPPDCFKGIVIASYNQAVAHTEGLAKARWDVFIVDEAHFAGSPTAQRTAMVYGKEGLGWHADRIWALSGTPAPTHAGQLWPMLRAFGIAAATYEEFTGAYCTFGETGLPNGTNRRNAAEVNAMMKRIMLRRRRVDVAPDMAPVTFEFLEVEPTSGVDFPGDDAEALEERANDLSALRIAVAGAKVRGLAQNILFALDNKLQRQAVVFGFHTEPLEDLARALRKPGYRVELLTGKTSRGDRVLIQDAFLDGRIDVVVGNIIAAGTAIDLSAASHGYFLELDWVPGNNLQAANRLISLQRREPVTLDVATWPGSFDDRIQRRLIRRAEELALLY